MVSTGKVKVSKLFGITQSDQRLFNKKQQIAIFDFEVIEISIIDI